MNDNNSSNSRFQASGFRDNNSSNSHCNCCDDGSGNRNTIKDRWLQERDSRRHIT